jgi:spore coat protein U-like protein
MNTKLNLKKLALAIGAMAIAGASFAATETATLTTTATVQNVCSIGPGTAAGGQITLKVNDAGTRNDIDTTFDTSISVVCTIGAVAKISAGFNTDDVADQIRNMKGTANGSTAKLAYALSSNGTSLNGEGVVYTGTGEVTTPPIQVLITNIDLAKAPKGDYTDTVTLTVTYEI